MPSGGGNRPIRGTNAEVVERWKKIHSYKVRGYLEKDVAELLGISVKTVKRYWNKTSNQVGKHKWDRDPLYIKYRPIIVEKLREKPNIQIETVKRILKEFFDVEDLGVTDGTFRLFFHEIRDQIGVEKPSYSNRPKHRVPIEGAGKKAFVDMGQKKIVDMYGNEKKVYFWIIVLDYSRMKYVYFQDKPFDAPDFIMAHEYAFKYFNGVPQEIYYDQDRVMVFAENRGDIVYQEDFAEYLKHVEYKVYLCRGHDPNTKGKVENAVRFVKYNFLDEKEYCGIDNLNASCLEWLDKVGNGVLNASTKHSPKALFEQEKNALMKYTPYPMKTKKRQILTVTSLYDITYKKNIYSVPIELVKPHDRVLVEESQGMINIYNPETMDLLAVHKLIKGVGGMSIQAQRPEHHLKPTVEVWKDNHPFFKEFLDGVMEEVPRYFYDQFIMLREIIKRYGEQKVKVAVCIAMKRNIYSVPKVLEMLVAAEGEYNLRRVVPERLVKHYLEQAKGYERYGNFINEGVDGDIQKLDEIEKEDELEMLIEKYNKRVKDEEQKMQEELKKMQDKVTNKKEEKGEN